MPVVPGTADAAALGAVVAENLSHVRERIERAAREAGRDPSEIRLVAVSKTFAASHVRAAFGAGQIDFGENRVQEALGKMDETADLPIRWHLVGHLQSNKARKAAARFACIHSIDSVALLREVDRASEAQGTSPDLLVQVDLAGEATKYGASPEDVASIVEAAGTCRAARLVGLMTLPPWPDDPEDARPYFRELRALRERLESGGVPRGRVRELSMGMSRDLEVAVQEGATMVRVGTALFGPRHV
jgi:pyridoxal phosphate enzyme (YggS family)